MKKTSIILIPVVVILLLIAAAFVYRTSELNSRVSRSAGSLPNAYSGGAKPEQGMGTMTGGNAAVTPAADNGQTSDLTKDLNGTVDDGGAGDLQNLKNQAAQL